MTDNSIDTGALATRRVQAAARRRVFFAAGLTEYCFFCAAACGRAEALFLYSLAAMQSELQRYCRRGESVCPISAAFAAGGENLSVS
jgi:hypothetical protein